MTRRATKSKSNIFLYSDFRMYLFDLVKELKEKQPNFTMRNFAKKAGLGSPSFLKMVLDGKRNLTQKSMTKFCDALDMKGRRREYFCLLVDYNQSHDPDQKLKFYQKLDSLRPKVAYSKSKQNLHKYLSNDYYTSIRQMIALKDFQEDAKWIASKCLPRIKPAQAREAIKTMLEMELLKRDKSGKLYQSQPKNNTKAHVDLMEAFGYHEAMLDKARKYLTLEDKELNRFKAVTIPASNKLSQDIGKRIDAFKNEIQNLVDSTKDKSESVYQLNIQFFPVTSKKK